MSMRKNSRDWVPKFIDKLKSLPELRDVASDQLNSGLLADLTIDRDTASRLGILPATIDNTLYDAFGQRQVSTMFTQLNQYHVVLEVNPQFQQDPEQLKNIYVKSSTGQQVPLSAFTHFEPGAGSLAINHQGQFPVVTLSFNLAPGTSLGDAVNAINQAKEDLGLPPSIQATYQGTAAAFLHSLANEPILILAAIITVYIVLGVLYESYIHPITIISTLPSAGVGAILALLLCREEFSVIALIGIILLIGIVKKNAIMMIDFALEAERKDGKTPLEAIYEACLLRFRPIMMTTMAALARRIAAGARHRRRFRTAPSARHHDRRRIAAEPASDALHDAGRLPLLRSTCAARAAALPHHERRRTPGGSGLGERACNSLPIFRRLSFAARWRRR